MVTFLYKSLKLCLSRINHKCVDPKVVSTRGRENNSKWMFTCILAIFFFFFFFFLRKKKHHVMHTSGTTYK